MRCGAAIVLAIALAGCGSQSKTTTSVPSTATAGPPPAASGATPPGAPAALGAIAGRVLRSSDLAGFKPETRRALGINARVWVAEQGLPPGEQAKEAARLERLGFVAGVREQLSPAAGRQAEAISVVVNFKTPQGAREQLAREVQASKTHGASAFAVAKIPGAVGFGGNFGGNSGYNVGFTDGHYYYLVGTGFATGSTGAPTRQELIEAAQRLYARVHR